MMRTILDITRRPLVKFDPANKEHRRYYAKYRESRSWGWCPVEFWVPYHYGNVANMCEQKLTEYYLKSEFKIKFKKDQYDR
jgi:hypothetical protein